MSYFSDLHVLGQEEGHAAMRAQLAYDLAGTSRARTAPTSSPMFDLCPAARPVAQHLGLTPTRAVSIVTAVQEAQQPGLSAADLAVLTGLPLTTVQVVLDALSQGVAA